jgi:hypothetical protein
MATDDISPELAMVSPELSASERERLPERPWEEATDRAARKRPSRRPVRMRRDQSSTTQRAIARSESQLRRRWQARGFLAVGLAAALLVAVSSLRGGGDPAPPSVAVPGSKADLTAGPPRLLPNAGYVVSPRGSFLTARSGRSIVTFTLPVRCGGSDLVIRDIPVSGRSFRITRRAAGQVTVRLSGRVVRGQEITGRVAATGGACAPRRVAFRARVS